MNTDSIQAQSKSPNLLERIISTVKPAQGAEPKSHRTATGVSGNATQKTKNVAPKSEKTSALYQKGKEKFKVKDYQGALAEFSQLEAINPHHQHARSIIGKTYQHLGLKKEYISYMQAAIEFEPKNTQYIAELASYLSRQNSHDEAGKLYTAALELEPDNAKIMTGYATALAKQDKIDEALKFYRMAAAREPDNLRLIVSLSNLLCKLGKPDEAEKHLRNAQPDGVDETGYASCMANCLALQLKFSEALPQYLAAVEQNPANPSLLLRLADVYTGLGRFKEAVVTLDTYLKAEPKSEVNVRRRNILNQRMGIFTEPERQTRFFAINVLKNSNRGLSAVQTRVAEEALETGIALTSIDELFDGKEQKRVSAAISRVMEFRNSEKAQKLIEDINNCEDFNDDPQFAETFKPSVVNYIVTNGPISAADPMVQMFTSNKILDIANQYNGMLSKLRNVNLWINPAVKGKNLGVRKGSQIWHRDQEDEKILKCFIYLTDVDAESGALDYVKYSKCIPEKKHSTVHPYPFSSGYPSKYVFSDKIPAHDQLTVSCRQGTIAFVDTNGFHRGGYVTKGERIVLMSTYLRPTSPYAASNTRLQLSDDALAAFSMEAMYAIS